MFGRSYAHQPEHASIKADLARSRRIVSAKPSRVEYFAEEIFGRLFGDWNVVDGESGVTFERPSEREQSAVFVASPIAATQAEYLVSTGVINHVEDPVGELSLGAYEQGELVLLYKEVQVFAGGIDYTSQIQQQVQDASDGVHVSNSGGSMGLTRREYPNEGSRS